MSGRGVLSLRDVRSEIFHTDSSRNAVGIYGRMFADYGATWLSDRWLNPGGALPKFNYTTH